MPAPRPSSSMPGSTSRTRGPSLGLLLFSRAPLDGTLVRDVLPGMLLLGLGAGIAFNPVLMAAMSEVPQTESGLASGIINTAFMMGGSLGLAALASIAGARSGSLAAAGGEHLAALAGGYQTAFMVGAGFVVLGALLGCFLREAKAPAGETVTD